MLVLAPRCTLNLSAGRVFRALAVRGAVARLATAVALAAVAGRPSVGAVPASDGSEQAHAEGGGLHVAAPQSVTASPYVWPRGPSPDPGSFPLAVWLQDPSNAEAYKNVGINTFIALWEGPRDDQLDRLTAAGMQVMVDQNETALSRLGDRVMTGWMQQDEPDNAQSDGMGGWGPCVEPAEIIARYEAMRAADPTRPVFLNLGQNVAWDYDNPYIGRGSECSDRWDQYPEYVKGADIVAFDIYPVTSEYDEIRDNLWHVARGVDRLREWTRGEKIVWNVIETAHINSDARPTVEQIESEVWMSLVHGSMGIVYFVHEWVPQFREAALLFYPEIRAGVSRINHEILELAPILNSPTVQDGVVVTSSNALVPVDVMAKSYSDATYLFAVAMRDGDTEATFKFARAADGTVEVLGENRTIPVKDGEFRDDFSGYQVHKYRLAAAATPTPSATAVATASPTPEATNPLPEWRVWFPVSLNRP